MKQKPDIYWRKALLAARILIREREGRLTPRDRKWAGVLAKDPGVTDRLIDQALAVWNVRKLKHVVA